MVSPLIARLINGKMAKLIELQTVYSVHDAWVLDEILNTQEEIDYLRMKANGSN